MSKDLESLPVACEPTDIYLLDFLNAVEDLLQEENVPENLKYFLSELIASHEDLFY